jgi:hypothetical protein
VSSMCALRLWWNEGVDHAVHGSELEQVWRDADAADQLARERVGPGERTIAFAISVEMAGVALENFAAPNIWPCRVFADVLHEPLHALRGEIQRAEIVDHHKEIIADVRDVSPRLA